MTSSFTREAWPDELDALVAAPKHHLLLYENESVRVFDTRIAPGDRTPLHTQRWPAVYFVVSSSAFVRRDAEDRVTLDTRTAPSGLQPGTAVWGEPQPPHSVENVGDTELRVISVELKQAPAKYVGGHHRREPTLPRALSSLLR